MTAATVDDRLAWEERQRPRAALAALLGGVLTVAAGVFNSLALGDAPRALFLDALRNAAEPGTVGSSRSVRLPQYAFFQDNVGAIVGGAVLLGLAALAASGALTFLAFAARHRHERLPRLVLYVPFVGGVLVLVGSVVTAFGSFAFVNALLDSAGTVDALRDTDQPPGLLAGQIIVQFGGLTLAAAYVLVCLNAMRVGLLTRALGVVGILVGLLVVLPVALLSQLLQPLWLFALTWLLLGRWPGGIPPAWRTGRPEPWPTGAQLREQAQERRRDRGSQPTDAREEAPAPVPDAGRAHPSSKKRKRKRRG